MTLRETLKGAIENPLRDLDDKAEWIEQLADEFAIGFAEWIRENYYDNGKCWTNSKDDFTTTELLQIYKTTL